MRSKSLTFLYTASLILLTAAALPLAASAETETRQRVLILPFEIHAPEDMTFLENGILDMLSTRLNIPGKVEPIPEAKVREAIASMPKPISPNAAVLLGVSLGARYVVHGSLTVFGQAISTDARLLDVTSSEPVVVFNQAGQSPGEAIQHVNRFAARVAAEVFGEPDAIATAPAPTPRPAPAAPTSTASSDVRRAHPEKIFKETFDTGEEEWEGDAFGAPEGARRLTTPLWRSRRFRTAIRGLTVADVDKDGLNETVFIDEHTVFVYRHADGAFRPVAEVAGDLSDSFLTVDAADINGNGIAEIFVNCVSQSNGYANSFVLEWDGTAFTRIADGHTLFWRVVDLPERGPVLFGQNQGIDHNLSGRPYEMVWQAGDFDPTQGMELPAGANVFGFALGRLIDPGQITFAVFTESDMLRLMDSAGSEDWRSEDPVGGTLVYIEPPSWVSASEGIKQTRDAEMYLRRFYLPQRLEIVDLDQDGKDEVLVINNIDRTRRLLKRARIFKSGRVRCLAWETVGLYPLWQTRRVSGHMADLAVADFDNDGSRELVVPVVARGAFLGAEARSFLMAQELP